MLVSVVILFLLAASFGLALLIPVLQDKLVNNTTLILHGSFAAIAIALMLGYVIVYGGSLLLIISLILFIGASVGGLTLFMLNKNKKKVPKALAIIHPLVAIAAIITLVIYVLP